MDTIMIDVRNLVKRFAMKSVLDGLDFQAGEGEFVAILGPNGAGKTTFLRILASLSRPSQGDIRIAGYKLPGQASDVRRQLGVVTHQTLLYGDLSAEENLNFYARMFGLRNPKRIGQILEWTGLAARKRDLVRTFSRGMQQRLSIGRAILHEPQVLLLDEPHTGLDQEACDMLDGLLRDVAKNGSTVLLTSHDMTRVEYLAGRFDILSGGRIKASTMKTGLGGGNLLDFYRKVLAGAG